MYKSKRRSGEEEISDEEMSDKESAFDSIPSSILEVKEESFVDRKEVSRKKLNDPDETVQVNLSRDDGTQRNGRSDNGKVHSRRPRRRDRQENSVESALKNPQGRFWLHDDRYGNDSFNVRLDTNTENNNPSLGNEAENTKDPTKRISSSKQKARGKKEESHWTHDKFEENVRQERKNVQNPKDKNNANLNPMKEKKSTRQQAITVSKKKSSNENDVASALNRSQSYSAPKTTIQTQDVLIESPAEEIRVSSLIKEIKEIVIEEPSARNAITKRYSQRKKHIDEAELPPAVASEVVSMASQPVEECTDTTVVASIEAPALTYYPTTTMTVQPMITSTGQVVYMTENGLMMPAETNYFEYPKEYVYNPYSLYSTHGSLPGSIAPEFDSLNMHNAAFYYNIPSSDTVYYQPHHDSLTHYNSNYMNSYPQTSNYGHMPHTTGNQSRISSTSFVGKDIKLPNPTKIKISAPVDSNSDTKT